MAIKIYYVIEPFPKMFTDLMLSSAQALVFERERVLKNAFIGY